MHLILLLSLLPYTWGRYVEGRSNSDAGTCGDPSWTRYEDKFCVKLIDKLMSYEEAEARCHKEILLDSVIPNVLQIKSEAEHKFITKLMLEKWRTTENVWIGAKRIHNSEIFEWSDETPVAYSNWAIGQPGTVYSYSCTQMAPNKMLPGSSVLSEASGLWFAVPCAKSNLVICQKPISIMVMDLMQVVSDLRKNVTLIEENNVVLRNKIANIEREGENQKTSMTKIQHENRDLKKNLVPVGFIYMQLPTEKSPKELWPTLSWKDDTARYAGLFFRVLGGKSGEFGKIQKGGLPQITSVKYERYATRRLCDPQGIEIKSGRHNYLCIGEYYDGRDDKAALDFIRTMSEVRPKNTAIRIWIRTK